MSPTSPQRSSDGVVAEAFLALGSNLDDRQALVDEAVGRLAGLDRTRLVARSSYYRTEPVGPVAQEWFLNIAIELLTELDPDALLQSCHSIEAELGRRRAVEIRWGPRLIDIDIIAFDNVVRADSGLTLPHPRFAERGFVLVPLAEIAAGTSIGGRTIAQYLAEVDVSGVEKLDWPVPPV
jgi:2-amino-4-hydroxy-6-hydroxymethyldihydropteridine diphosphokinase